MKVAVVGAGAWGTAFAMQLAHRGHDVLLWVWEPELLDLLRTGRENTYYLPGFTLPSNIDFTNDLAAAVTFSDSVVFATPSFALRSTVERAAELLTDRKVLVLTKGLERESFLPMGRVIEDAAGSRPAIAVLSGPSFAREVAERLFTSVVVASTDKTTARQFQEMSHDDRFRVYTADDVVGVELGGALKNVMAIGAGIIEGLHLGSNTLAAYITRALAEMKRLGKRLGARETTFMGLSGIGDLILTCTGPLSRNRTFGIELAHGKPALHLIESQKAVVEGFYTIDAAYRFSRKLGVEMPITEELYRVVYEGKDIRASFEDIRHREIKEEDG
jgi:glycerol-3-phosphate dehydrogenase (NAD(P)+)